MLAQRAAKRDREPRRVPDATLSFVLREISSWEPLDEVAPPAHMTLSTDRPIEDLAAELLGLLDQCIGRIDA